MPGPLMRNVRFEYLEEEERSGASGNNRSKVFVVPAGTSMLATELIDCEEARVCIERICHCFADPEGFTAFTRTG